MRGKITQPRYDGILLMCSRYECLKIHMKRKYLKNIKYIELEKYSDINALCKELKNKPMVSDYWYINLEVSDRLLNSLKNNAPFKHSKIIVEYDWRKKWLIDKHKLYENHDFTVIDISFPNTEEILYYCKTILTREDVGESLLKYMISRDSDIENYKSYIEILNYYPNEINEEIINEIVPDKNDVTVNNVARGIIKGNKKQPFEILENYLEYEPNYILACLRNHFSNVRMAKICLNKGLKPSYVMDKQLSIFKMRLLEEEKENKFFKLSNRKINNYLRQAMNITMTQIYYIENILNKYKFVDELKIRQIISLIKNHGDIEIARSVFEGHLYK